MAFPCYGGLLRAGIIAGLACLETVNEPGLNDVAIGCPVALSPALKTAVGKAVARQIVTVRVTENGMGARFGGSFSRTRPGNQRAADPFPPASATTEEVPS